MAAFAPESDLPPIVNLRPHGDRPYRVGGKTRLGVASWKPGIEQCPSLKAGFRAGADLRAAAGMRLALVVLGRRTAPQ